MKPLDLRQVQGFLHAPEKHVKRLALTASKALEKVEQLERELRELQERQAADGQPVLVLAWHTGLVEVKADAWQPVKVISVNDAGTPETSEDAARTRTPTNYQSLFDCKTIAAGSIGLDKYKTAYVDAELAIIQGLRDAR